MPICENCRWLRTIVLLALTSVLCTCLCAADAPRFRNTEQLEDGQWLTPSEDYANTQFSGLKEITPDNVGKLKMAWSFSTGISRGHEAAPLVVGNIM